MYSSSTRINSYMYVVGYTSSSRREYVCFTTSPPLLTYLYRITSIWILIRHVEQDVYGGRRNAVQEREEIEHKTYTGKGLLKKCTALIVVTVCCMKVFEGSVPSFVTKKSRVYSMCTNSIIPLFLTYPVQPTLKNKRTLGSS